MAAGPPCRTSYTCRRHAGAATGPAAAALALCLLAAGGCRKPPATPPEVARDVTERGPLKLTVEASPRQPRVGDVVTINVVVEAPEAYQVRLPAADSFGELAARDTAAPDPQPGATGVIRRRSFLIEPLVSGALEIPALGVKYVRPPMATETQPSENELLSNPLKLEVRSALTKDDTPTRPRDITGTLLPPKPPLKPWQWGVIMGGIAGAIAGAYAAYRAIRRRALRPPPPILPEVWALRALAELASGDWFTAERVREYYYRLTEIVRSYIERKFNLAAPEMTTEEFLATLARDQRALPYDAVRLGVFLEACDFVKYAALHPRREDAENALATARAFVNATAAASAAPRLAAANSPPSQEGVGGGWSASNGPTLPQPLPMKDGSAGEPAP